MRPRKIDEQLIREYLLGHASAEELDRALCLAREILSPSDTRVHVRDMSEGFRIDRAMALRICEDAIAGRLQASSVEDLAFVIIASEALEWEEELVGEVLHDWAAPEINYPLTLANLQRFRLWLAGEEPYPEVRGANPAPAGRSPVGTIVSSKEKKRSRR